MRGQARINTACPCSYLKEKFMEQFLQVGVITQTHGIHGEVKVFPTTDDPQRFKNLKQVILNTGNIVFRNSECKVF